MTPSTNGNDERERKKKNVKGREGGGRSSYGKFFITP